PATPEGPTRSSRPPGCRPSRRPRLVTSTASGATSSTSSAVSNSTRWRRSPSGWSTTSAATGYRRRSAPAPCCSRRSRSCNSDRPALAVLPVLASTLPIALRRAFPIPVLAITQTALLVEALSVGTERGALGLASALAMYTVARHHERSLSLRIALTVAAIQVSAVLVAVLIGRPGTAVDAIPAVVILAGSWALGDNVRTRRAYLASLEE